METQLITNIADLKARELDMAKKLLDAAYNGYPEDFDLDGVQFWFNRDTGDLFLTNDSGQLCIASEGELYSYYFLPACGKEGTIYDLVDEYTKVESEEDREYIQHVVSTFYNDEFTLPKRTKDGKWLKYGDKCYRIDKAERKVVEFDWDTIDETDNENENIDAYFSIEEAEEELAELQDMQDMMVIKDAKVVLVVNAKIASYGENYETICVLQDTILGNLFEQKKRILTKQVFDFCEDKGYEVTETEAAEIAESIITSDYGETQDGNVLFIGGTYEILGDPSK